MGRQPLTDRQQQALDFIKSNIAELGYPPTLREIGTHMGIRSTNGVNDHLKALERKGYLVREELQSRAMRPVDEAKVSIPILGRVAAGQPMLAIEQADARVSVDRFFLGSHTSRDLFCLSVRGDSMIEDGIFDGDYIFVRRQSTPSNGDVVVVMLDGEARCRRFFAEGERVRLQSANAAMAPIYPHRSEFCAADILGTVVGLYRRVGG